MYLRMNKILFAVFFVAIGIFGFKYFAGGSGDGWICGEEGWIKYGNPSSPMPEELCGEIIPSENPRENQIEECKSQSGNEMRVDDALLIGEKQCLGGKIDMNKEYFCNDYTGTWWIGFVPDEPKEGCSPACVVDIETKVAEINWRCTGIIEEN